MTETTDMTPADQENLDAANRELDAAAWRPASMAELNGSEDETVRLITEMDATMVELHGAMFSRIAPGATCASVPTFLRGEILTAACAAARLAVGSSELSDLLVRYGDKVPGELRTTVQLRFFATHLALRALSRRAERLDELVGLLLMRFASYRPAGPAARYIAHAQDCEALMRLITGMQELTLPISPIEFQQLNGR